MAGWEKAFRATLAEICLSSGIFEADGSPAGVR